MTISIRSVEKQFARYPALRGVSLDVQPGELLALLGPSGSGKTTLLRIIAGLEFPEAGQIVFDDRDVTFASAAARRVGFVFQQYALFRHMTVAKNVAFGLDVRKAKDKPARAEINRRVEELLGLVELGGLGARYPAQLSGGQRQRVALARALAVSPEVLLLDEPFGALDATVRKSLRKELRRIHNATGVTTIFVTHDQEEALDLADRVAILNHGIIEQVGTPTEVYDQPASAFVCGFVGETNRFDGTVEGGRFTDGAVSFAVGSAAGPKTAFVRPHDLTLTQDGETGFMVKVERVVAQGPVLQVEAVTLGGKRLDVAFARQDTGGVTAGASLSLTARKAHLFDPA
jgi:sulfate transport system ATP-binding protein